MGAIKLENLPHYTYEDYAHWEGNWELISGVAYAMAPAPMPSHQEISQKIATMLGNALQDCKQCKPLLPIDWKIAEDTIVQPDNLVICFDHENRPFITQAPSLIFEVVSKSSYLKDTGIKYDLYEREGVKYYVIIYPEDQTAKVYENFHGRFAKKIDAKNESVEFDLGSCGFTLDFSRIW